jgi:(5-formylfuran-3-yl)methyl phosphate synthase
LRSHKVRIDLIESAESTQVDVHFNSPSSNANSLTAMAPASRPLQLLISVRDAAEAQRAVRGGANWIDVKEPQEGPLGMANPSAIEAVVRSVAARCPVSVALGELRDWSGQHRRAFRLPASVCRAKVGLSGCGALPDWPEQWNDLARGLPSGAGLVAVQYADWQACGAPSPEQLLAVAARFACRGWLIDTYQKSAASLFEHVLPGVLEGWIATARKLGMTTVVAGGLQPRDCRRVRRAGADVIAFRGAACTGHCRTSSVSLRRVVELRRNLDEQQAEFARFS